MKIEKIDLKKKVMLALLAGNLLCSANALAANTYVLNGGAPVTFDATSGYDPTAFNKTGNTIVFNIQEEYGDHSADPVVVPTFPLTGALDMTGDFVTLSGHDVTMNVEAGVYVVQNACAAVAQKGIVRDNKLTVNGGIFFTNNDLIGSGIIGIAAGYSMDGDVINNKAFITGVTCGVAGAGYTASDGGKAYNNVLTVTDCTISQFLVGAAAMEEPLSPAFGGNVQHNKLIINGNSQISAWVYGGISRGTVTNPLPAIDNSVEINGGTFSRYIYGVETTSEAVENYVIINNGTINDAVEGACVKASATGNYVIVNGGTFASTNPDAIISIFGGEVEGGSPDGSFAKKNYVILNGGTFKNAQVYGAFNRAENGIAGSGSATGDPNDGNWVTVNNATFNSGIGNKIYGASASGTNGQAYNNKVTINNGTFTGAADFSLEIAGGKADNAGTASNNSVNINNGTFIAAGAGKITIMGAEGWSNAISNLVTIKNGTFQGAEIFGGKSGGVSSSNKVVIDGGTFNGTNDNKIYGGCTTGMTGLANNEVLLNGGIFSKAIIIAAEGNALASSGNKITIAAGSNALDLSGATLMGYETTGDNNRTLDVARTNVAVEDIKNFGTINFNLAGASSDANVLKMDGTFDVSTLNSVNINITNSPLTGDDYIVLMQNVTGTYGGSSTGIMKLGNDLIYYVGTAPAQAKADYTAIDGAGGVQEGRAGTYTDPMIFADGDLGMGEMTGATSNTKITIRKGTYSGDGGICGAVRYMSPGNVNNNEIYIVGGTFNTLSSGGIVAGMLAVGTISGNVFDNKIVIDDGNFTFNASIADDAQEVIAAGLIAGDSESTGNSVYKNSIEFNGGTFNGEGTISAGVKSVKNANPSGIVGGSATNGNKIVVNSMKLGDSAKYRFIGGDGNSNNSHYIPVSYNSVIINNVVMGSGAELIVYGGRSAGDDGTNIVYGGNTDYNYVELHAGVYNGVYGGAGARGVTHNEVEIDDGDYKGIVVGGHVWGGCIGDANYNKVTVNGGTFAANTNIYGGYTEKGSAEHNSVKIVNGTFGADCIVYGGNAYKEADDIVKNAKNNIVEILGVTMDSSAYFKTVYGGVGTGDVSNNSVIISAGSYQAVVGGNSCYHTAAFEYGVFGNSVKMTGGTLVGGTPSIIGWNYDGHVYGGIGGNMGTAVTENTVELDGVTIKDSIKIYGAFSLNNATVKNSVTVANLQCEPNKYSEIYGGYSGVNSSSENIVTIKSGAWEKVYGGYGSTGAESNNVIIDDGNFKDSGKICGGYSTSGNAENNSVSISSGNFGNSMIIGGNSEGSGTVSNNVVTVADGTFGSCEIRGGYSASGTASDNTVNINGGDFANGFKLYGGFTNSGTSTNNTLNLKIKMSGKASEVKFFQNMNFTLPSNITNGDVMLETQSVTYDTTTVSVTAANGVKLNKDDVIYLVKADNINSTTIANDEESVLNGAAIVKLDGNDLILTLLQDFEQKKSAGSEDQQKAPVEGVAAAAVIVNASADLASGEGMASLIANTAGGGTDTFGAMSAGSSKYKTGSHVDIDGWGMLVGTGKTKEWGNGEATSLGVFFEYGKGDFDTYNGDVHGDGNSKNQGIGIMMRHKMLNNTYYEGNIRYGKQKTEWSESELGSYDTDSKYYGIMVGMGHIFPAGKNEIDVYGRYTFGHVGACDATIGDSHYNFESVKSHRVRLGAKYNFVQEKSNAKPFIGLAWEHEFKGESKASISGVGEAPAPSMKGHTGIMEVGCDWDVSKKWTLGLGANAYMGKRKGWDGMARVFYNF